VRALPLPVAHADQHHGLKLPRQPTCRGLSKTGSAHAQGGLESQEKN
jgi:hypothetical protein